MSDCVRSGVKINPAFINHFFFYNADTRYYITARLIRHRQPAEDQLSRRSPYINSHTVYRFSHNTHLFVSSRYAASSLRPRPSLALVTKISPAPAIFRNFFALSVCFSSAISAFETTPTQGLGKKMHTPAETCSPLLPLPVRKVSAVHPRQLR